MKATITYTPNGPRIDIEGTPEEVAVYTRGVMAGGAMVGAVSQPTPRPAPRPQPGKRKSRDPAAIEKQRQKMLAYWAAKRGGVSTGQVDEGGDNSSRGKA